MSPITLNAGLSLAIVASMTLIYLNVIANDRPIALVYSVHPSTTMAFFFFGTAWIFVVCLYTILLATDGKPTLPVWLLDNVSKLCLFATALSYSRVREFNLKLTLAVMAATLLLLSLWEVFFSWLSKGWPDDMLIGSLRLTPDVMLSGIGIVLIGWAFFVRWSGLFGWFFLLVTLAYSVLQFPATLLLGFDHFLADPIHSDLNIAFSCLAGAKVLLAFGFLSLVCESSDPALEIDRPSTWPRNPVSPPKWVFHLAGWGGGVVAGVAVGLISDGVKGLVPWPWPH
jgi:hypothetical protein